MCDQQACGHDRAQANGVAEDNLLLLDNIYSSAPVGFAFLDRHFRYVRVNERLASIDGCPVADHSGRTVQEVMPGLWPRVEPSFHWVLRSGESLVNLEVSGETIAAPGTVRHWATSIYAVHSQERTIGLGVLVTDITERKRAEHQAIRSERT
jgi:PAS domain S-box-containing protein